MLLHQTSIPGISLKGTTPSQVRIVPAAAPVPSSLGSSLTTGPSVGSGVVSWAVCWVVVCLWCVVSSVVGSVGTTVGVGLDVVAGTIGWSWPTVGSSLEDETIRISAQFL